MSNQNSMDFETFEIGGGIGDIGGDEIDLSTLSITDTLIGKNASELTAALGEPSLNEYENYHMGDGGISDIELTSFDSALINEAGIRPYTADDATSMDELNELAELMGKKIETPKAKKAAAKKEVKAEEPKPSAAKVAATALWSSMFIETSDKDAKDLIEDETAPWFTSEIYDENGTLMDPDKEDDMDFGDDEDAVFEMGIDELETLQKEYDEGKFKKFLTLVRK